MSILHQRGGPPTALAAQARLPCLPLLLLCGLLIGFLPLSACSLGPQPKRQASPTIQTATPTPNYAFPAVDANYVYDQLYYMSTAFQQRESGFDLDPEHNGHLAFAHYWAQAMQANLSGFAPEIAYDQFQGGWISRPADAPSYNVEVTIPGALDPEQVVIVGSHYDGMHVSQGSAFDDTSGCAILLGIARALGNYWRSHHLVPARTLRFVLFDAEEEGLLGSYHYLNSTVNGDTANIVGMLNEEQSGFSYPVRYLGLASNPVIPLHIWNAYNGRTFFSQTIQAALPQVSSEMQAVGSTSVAYHGAQGHDASLAVFTPDTLSQILIAGDPLGGSDDAAFDAAGVPALTFIAGDEGAYDPSSGSYQSPNIPDQHAYPFDTHLDTVQLMNGYANGATAKSSALVLALQFETMLQAWMVNQSDLVGTVPVDAVPAGPVATIGDIGLLQPAVALKLAAQSTYDPRASQAPPSAFSYHWTFGDGAHADGRLVQHTYAASGTYLLTLTIQDSGGTRQISKRLVISTSPPTYPNVFLPLLQRERDTDSPLARGDHTPPPNYQLPPVIQNGDGLTADDHFPGHGG